MAQKVAPQDVFLYSKPQRRDSFKKGQLFKGFSVEVVRETEGETIQGNNKWLEDGNGDFAWSGDFEISRPSTLQTGSLPWWIAEYGIKELWDLGFKGQGIKIAVLDSGVQLDHPDLNISSENTSDFSKSQQKGVNDREGHGTHLSGIVNGIHNENEVFGVAPEANLFVAKVTSNEWGDDPELLADAIDWAVSKNVDIISISKGFENHNDRLLQSIKAALQKPVLVVCAAGNFKSDRDRILFPAGFENVLSIGASTREKSVQVNSSVSSRIDLLAPGEEIYSTFKDSSYKRMSGTSQATPFVASTLALLVEACRKKNVAFSLPYFRTLLQQTGTPAIGSNRHLIINPIKAYENI
ncbi:MAG: S8 family peptidase [Owenweeksia sp.]